MAPCDHFIANDKDDKSLIGSPGFPLFLTQKVWQNTQRELSQRGCTVWVFMLLLSVEMLRLSSELDEVCLVDEGSWLYFYHLSP